MKNIKEILLLSAFFLCYHIVLAQKINYIDTFKKETESFIQQLNNEQAKIQIAQISYFGAKTIIRCTYKEFTFLVKQKTIYKKGFKHEKTIIFYDAIDQRKKVMEIIRINDEYTYIKRINYNAKNWKSKNSQETMVGKTYKKLEYNSPNKNLHFWGPHF